MTNLLIYPQSWQLFWLDGHYSAGLTARGATDCPIYVELESIAQLCKVPGVVLTDDALCFGRDKDYPSLQELENCVRALMPTCTMAVNNNLIQLIPKSELDSRTA